MKFNKNLSIIHAYLCADGYVIKNPETQKHKYYHIGLRNTNDVLLKDFQNRFEKVFGLKPHITNEGRCRIQNKKIYEFLTKDFSYYSRKWTMPKLSKENLRYWLRAFFDCESWVHVRKARDRHVGLDCVNEKGLLQIQKVLKTFNINSIIKKKKLLRLLIYGKDNLIQFQKEIGFLHPDKKKKLQEAIDSYINYNWDFSNKEKLLSSLLKNKSGKRIRICSVKKDNLVKLAEYLKELRIASKISYRENKHSKYFELDIHKKDSANRIFRL